MSDLLYNLYKLSTECRQSFPNLLCCPICSVIHWHRSKAFTAVTESHLCSNNTDTFNYILITADSSLFLETVQQLLSFFKHYGKNVLQIYAELLKVRTISNLFLTLQVKSETNSQNLPSKSVSSLTHLPQQKNPYSWGCTLSTPFQDCKLDSSIKLGVDGSTSLILTSFNSCEV